MSKWTVEIRIVDITSDRPMEIIERFDDEDTEMVLALCKATPGMFEYDGRSAYTRTPIVDPIRRKLMYVVELC